MSDETPKLLLTPELPPGYFFRVITFKNKYHNEYGIRVSVQQKRSWLKGGSKEIVFGTLRAHRNNPEDVHDTMIGLVKQLEVHLILYRNDEREAAKTAALLGDYPPKTLY